MSEITLHYLTNRNHEPPGQRWTPARYGAKFSDDGAENLRFGKLTLDADAREVERHLARKKHGESGDGEALSAYLAQRAQGTRITPYPEGLDRTRSDARQPRKRLGSSAMFADARRLMLDHTDIVVFVHGFNVRWEEAIGSAAALQLMLDRRGIGDDSQRVAVVPFTWPSDGLSLPFVSYKSDRTEAAASGYAAGRAMLRLRDWLGTLSAEVKGSLRPCGQHIHLLCHSMGNYVLEHALRRLTEHSGGSVPPRLFEHVFLCAPDVNDTVFEREGGLASLHAIARHVTLYHNREDLALSVSDHTKGNPERLGSGGVARPALLHHKIHQVDCTPLVGGVKEHSYHLWGPVNADIRQSIDALPFDDARRRRERDAVLGNVWRMK